MTKSEPLGEALKAQINALLDQAWELRNSDTREAHAKAKEARARSIEQGYKRGQARGARIMAMTVPDLHAVNALIELAEEAKDLFDEVGDDEGRAGSRDFLASIYEYMGDLAGALALALDALSIARDIKDPVRQGYALSNVGGILAASGEAEAGIEHLQEALELFKQVSDEQGIISIRVRLCEVFKNAGMLDKASQCAQECIEAARKATDDSPHYPLWAALSTLAEVEEAAGRLEKAEALYREALATEWGTETGRDAIGTKTQVALGKLLAKRGEPEQAEVELTDVLRRLADMPFAIVNEAAAHEALSELYESRGRPAEALSHLRSAAGLRAKIAEQDARNKRIQIEIRAKMEKARKAAEHHRMRFVELHEMQAKLVEAKKMALLGKLAAGAAHELNTPLGVLKSNNELARSAMRRLLERVPQEAKLASILESCQSSSDEAVERIGAIVQSFSRFTQLDQAQRRDYDVREGIESAVAMLRPSIGPRIQVRCELEEVPRIDAWPRELNHAFLTVLQNAIQAIDDEGEVSIETSASSEHVYVKICDTGRGMSKAELDHLFDVSWSEDGQRTKMRLGLSAAYHSMQKHGGSVEVQSAPGKGTTVTFRFVR